MRGCVVRLPDPASTKKLSREAVYRVFRLRYRVSLNSLFPIPYSFHLTHRFSLSLSTSTIPRHKKTVNCF